MSTSTTSLLPLSDRLRSYIDDFRGQYFQYENHREIFMAAPSSATDSGIISLRDLIDFISHVADCYPEITKDFPQELINILTLHHAVLEPELREKIVGSLVLLRKKNILDSTMYGSKLNVRGAALTFYQFTSNLLSSSHVNTKQNPPRPGFHQNPQ